MQDNHAQTVLDKIKKEHIAPDTRLQLCWKSYAFWTLTVAMIVLGIVILSFALVELSDIDNEFFRRLEMTRFFHVVLVSAPYVWITLMITVIGTGVITFRQTRRSYRFPLVSVLGMGITITFIGAIALHVAKVNEKIEESMARRMPFVFGPVNTSIEKRWNIPTYGLLGGRVEQTQEKNFLVFAFDGQIWTITYTDTTRFVPAESIRVGEMVRILGKQMDNETFHADIVRHGPARVRDQELRPWKDCWTRKKELQKHMQTLSKESVYTCTGHGKLAPGTEN